MKRIHDVRVNWNVAHIHLWLDNLEMCLQLAPSRRDGKGMRFRKALFKDHSEPGAWVWV